MLYSILCNIAGAGIQSLQGEVQRVCAVNQQLQQKLTVVAEARKTRTEADWKRLEAEKRVCN